MSGIHPRASSSFVNWLRRTASLPPKPKSGTATQWREWAATESKRAPRTHWFIEVFLDRLERLVYWPAGRLDNLHNYISNHFIIKTHVLRTGVTPGAWSDLDHRLLHANMGALVDFVECELAEHHYTCLPRDLQKTYGIKPRWWQPFRCPSAGLDHLDWAATLDQPGIEPHAPRQAEASREKLAIYHWWTSVRPARPDPMAESGVAAIFDKVDLDNEDVFDTSLRPPEWDLAYKRCREIEDQYAAEDEEMLIRLMKIRTGLWT